MQRRGRSRARRGRKRPAVACLVDELVAAGSTVVEGVGGVDGPTAHGEGLGICRLFVGRRGAAPPSRAFATAVGFQDDRSLRDRLASRGEDYTARVLAAVGIEQATVVFRLLWLPEDTGEALR